MKILVSGGTGFLGSWICRELSKDHDIRILTRQDSNSWLCYRRSFKLPAIILLDSWIRTITFFNVCLPPSSNWRKISCTFSLHGDDIYWAQETFEIWL
jgi:hypothetical protein